MKLEQFHNMVFFFFLDFKGIEIVPMVNFFFVDIWKIVPGIMFFRGGAPSPRIALFLI